MPVAGMLQLILEVEGDRIDWPLMYFQVLLKLLSVGKLGYVGDTPIIRNQGLGRIHICKGGMGNHTSLRLTKIFKISLQPLTVLHRLRRGSERGVNCD